MQQPQPPSPPPSDNPPKGSIPELSAETLIPTKRAGLSAFAWMVWGAVILILLSVGWLAYSKFDIDRLRGADHFVDQARAAVDAKDWPAALSAIQKVDGEARDQPKFWRILADYLIGTQTEPGTLSQTLEKVRTTPLWQHEDSIWLALAYLAQGRIGQARRTLEAVPASQRETLLYLDTKVTLLRNEGRAREAAEVEAVLFRHFAHDPAIAVRKAARELTGTFPEIQQAAVKQLWEIAKIPDSSGLTAMRTLTSYPGLSRAEANQLQKTIAAHPSATINDRLGIASVLLRVAPDEREAILHEQINLFKDSGNDTLQRLVAWLAKEKEFTKILKIVPRESLVQSVELFPAVAQDLAQRSQWSELMELIEKGRPLPVSNARAAGWRALATRNLHPDDTRAARAHLEEAIAEGLNKNDQQALAAAITLAEEWNMLDLSLETTLKMAVPGSPNESPLLDKCWRLASTLKHDATLAKIAERLHKLKPDNPIFARRRDYLRLLRGEQIEITAPNEEEKAASNDVPEGQLLLQALKAYRMQDRALAAAIIGKIGSTTAMTSGESAVYAGLLACLLGEAARAYNLAEKIRPEVLLEQERPFLHMALN